MRDSIGARTRAPSPGGEPGIHFPEAGVHGFRALGFAEPRYDERRVSCALHSGEPGVAARLRERAHPADIGGALGDADNAAGIEQIEQVACLQALVVGRQRQLWPVGTRLPGTQQRVALPLGILEMLGQDAGISALKIVGGELALATEEYIA